MKYLFPFLALLFFQSALPAQTKSAPNNLAAGGGMEWYRGDLGNSFFDFEEEWYGFFSLAYSRYLSRSFDLRTAATIGEIGRCFDGVIRPEDPPILMLRSRLKTLGIALKYKLANGYLLREEAKVGPYIYLGAAFNHQRDIWTDQPRVNEGSYCSVNGGLGLVYRFARHLQLGYNLGLGYFTTDKMDFIASGGNDLYLQNTFSLGLDF